MYNWAPGEENENRAENIFEEIMDTNFPNVLKTTGFQIQEAQQTPSKINKTKQKPPKHIMVKADNTKDRKS